MSRARALLRAASSAAARRRAGACRAADLALNPCQITHPLRLTVVAAECGVLEVAENPAAPGGRRIGLHVARVAAINRRKQADALFVLAGGPGQGAGEFYASVAPAFARIRRDRVIVLLDQRGTGASHALSCPGEGRRSCTRPRMPRSPPSHSAAEEGLRAQADPAFYTTSIAVADLERVRAALGYGTHRSLRRISYGTRVAQQYLRRFRASARSSSMGWVPPQRALGPEVALVRKARCGASLHRCQSQAPCRALWRSAA
jgi:pimeloyl-ACP methyl ester carboxylesterase